VGVRDDGLERSCGHEGHHHPEAAVDGEGAVGFEDVGVREEGEGFGLAANVVQVGAGTVQVYGFDCHHGGVHGDADGFVHDGAHAGADLVEEFVGGRVEWVLEPFGCVFYLVGCHGERVMHCCMELWRN